jgi:hypothetical protein
MIAFHDSSKLNDSAWHHRFMAMLPALRRAACFRFRHLSPSRKREVIDDVVGTCCAFYARLVEKGEEKRAHFSSLVTFAAAQLGQGRQIGNHLSSKDVSSQYAQRRNGFQVERLDQFDASDDEWKQILIEDKNAGPAETAASRIDFAERLSTMPSLRRQIAECLATGASTSEAAERFALSPGRISQIRGELRDSWDDFHGEMVTASAAG